MSVISEKVRAALYAKLNVSSVLTGGTGLARAVYYQHAPDGAQTPYVVFNRVASARVKRATFGNSVLEDDLWDIKAIVEAANSSTLGPIELAQDILEDCEAAINESLTVTGNTVEYVKREADNPGFRELVNDRYIYHEGFQLRVQTS